MKPDDRNKLNQCLDILDTTDLGLSLVWLWTWSQIKYNMDDLDYVCTATEEEMWDHLCEAVEAGMGFSLEYGAEQLTDDVRDWMFSRGYLVDPEDEEDDDGSESD